MILSMSRQALLFLSTIGVGMVLGFIYDIFRILRKTAPHRSAVIQVEDLLFWVSVTLLTFYFLLNRNYGEIRLFAILGTVLGMALYFATVSRLVMGVSMAVINFMKRVLMTALKIICTPIRLLIRLLTPPGRWIAKIFRKRLHSIKMYAKMGMRRVNGQWQIIRKKT